MKNKNTWLAIPCAAMLLAAGSVMTTQAATGWVMEGEEWVYYNGDGTKATDVFKKSGNNWYYLDSDGSMVYSSVVEVDDDYYYVNSAGAMVTNEWRAVDNEDAGSSEDEPDQWWYYFQANGKAVKRSGSSDRVKFSTLNTSTGPAKFTFDEEGHMLFGWIDESGEMLTDDDAWKNGLYYCGENGNGRMTTGWKYIEAVNDEDEDREGEGYWFWFGTNGKKTSSDDSKRINGRKYRFDENGAAHFEWYNDPGATNSTVSSAGKYYNTEEQCWLSTGWFKAIPDENADPEGYEDGEEVWYYAQSDGDLVKSQIKRINGQSYGFDEFGKMLHGLYVITYDTDGKTILTADKIEDEDQLPDTNDDTAFVYYFGDSPKEGAMETGTATLEIDGEKYYYSFQKSGSKKGAGTEGIDDDCIYIEGRRLEAEEGSKYQVVSYDGNDYLINTSGKLAKNKKNVKDADGVYYKTDKKGVVLESSEDKID